MRQLTQEEKQTIAGITQKWLDHQFTECFYHITESEELGIDVDPDDEPEYQQFCDMIEKEMVAEIRRMYRRRKS